MFFICCCLNVLLKTSVRRSETVYVDPIGLRKKQLAH